MDSKPKTKSAVDPAHWCLFLDIDGTMLDIEAIPSEVAAPPQLITTLVDLVRAFQGGVAFITGRPIAEADRLLAPLRLVGAGVHGAQLRLAPHGETLVAVPSLPMDLVAAVADLVDEWPGVFVEDKGAGVTVHYRLVPDARDEIGRRLGGLIARAPRPIKLVRGRMVWEVLAMECSKHTAVERLRKLPLFRGRKPVVIGDDAGDDLAIAGADSSGGLGLRVAGEHFAAAISDFQGPAEVRAWLMALARKRSEPMRLATRQARRTAAYDR